MAKRNRMTVQQAKGLIKNRDTLYIRSLKSRHLNKKLQLHLDELPLVLAHHPMLGVHMVRTPYICTTVRGEWPSLRAAPTMKDHENMVPAETSCTNVRVVSQTLSSYRSAKVLNMLSRLVAELRASLCDSHSYG